MANLPDKLPFEDNEFFKNLPSKTKDEIVEQKRKEEEACKQRDKILREIAFVGIISGALLGALAAVMNGNPIHLGVIICALYGGFIGFVVGRFFLNHIYSTILFGLPLMVFNLFCMDTIVVTLVLYPCFGVLLPIILDKWYQKLEPF